MRPRGVRPPHNTEAVYIISRHLPKPWFYGIDNKILYMYWHDLMFPHVFGRVIIVPFYYRQCDWHFSGIFNIQLWSSLNSNLKGNYCNQTFHLKCVSKLSESTIRAWQHSMMSHLFDVRSNCTSLPWCLTEGQVTINRLVSINTVIWLHNSNVYIDRGLPFTVSFLSVLPILLL